MQRPNKVYAFVGIPNLCITYSKIIDNVDVGDTLERELDDMTDFIDCTRKHHPVWATFPVEQVSFTEACKKFGEYMECKKSV